MSSQMNNAVLKDMSIHMNNKTAPVVVVSAAFFLIRPSVLPCLCAQVKIFGSFVRWSQDLAPPHTGLQGLGRVALSTVDTAIRAATGTGAGPAGGGSGVHMI